MKAENTTTPHNRVIKITDIPKHPDFTNLPTELEIHINYSGNSSASKGIILDSIIIPAILKGLNKRNGKKKNKE